MSTKTVDINTAKAVIIPYSDVDTLSIKNIDSANDLMFFFDITKDGETKYISDNNVKPYDDVYIIKKSELNNVISKLEDDDLPTKGVIEIDYFMGSMNNEENPVQSFGDGYVETIHTLSSKGIVKEIDIEKYIEQVKEGVKSVLQQYNYTSAFDALMSGNKTVKNALIAAYTTVPFKLDITGTVGNDVINGEAGNDTIYTGQGNDTVNGGEGKNIIVIGNSGEAGSETTIIYDGGKDLIDLTQVNPDGWFEIGNDGKVRGHLNAHKVGDDMIIKYSGRIEERDSGDYDSYSPETDSFYDKTIKIKDYYKNGQNAGIKVKIQVRDYYGGTPAIEGIANLIDTAETRADYRGKEGSTTLQIQGTFTNDYMHGSRGADIIHGDDGNDYINGEAGDDIIYGGNGNDRLRGKIGNDTLYGGDGDDEIEGDAGNDVIYGGLGENVIILDTNSYTDETFDDEYYSSLYRNDNWEEADKYYAQHLTGGGDDIVYSGEGTDTIAMWWTNSEITISIKGYDLILYSTNTDNYYNKTFTSSMTIKDYLKLGDNHSVQYVNTEYMGDNNTEGRVTLREFLADKIISVEGQTNIYGKLDGEDVPQEITAEQLYQIMQNPFASNVIEGDDNNNNLKGTADDDLIMGYGGNDTIKAGAGDDYIYGGVGNDTVYGEAGNDKIYVGQGNDNVYGGQGKNTIVIESNSTAGAETTIYYGGGSDTVDLTQVKVKSNFYEEYVPIPNSDEWETVIKGGITSTEKDGNDLIIRYSTLEDPYMAMAEYENSDEAYDAVFDKKVRIKDFYTLDNPDIKLLLSINEPSYFNDYLSLNISDAVINVIDYSGNKGTEPREINGTFVKDYIDGSAGSDIIYGGAGDDKIEGGAGDDALYGGNGENELYFNISMDETYDEAYYYSLIERENSGEVLPDNWEWSYDYYYKHLTSPGHDIVYSGSGIDTIVFNQLKETMEAPVQYLDSIPSFTLRGNDLIITYNKNGYSDLGSVTESSIVLKDYFTLGENHSVKYINPAGGVEKLSEHIKYTAGQVTIDGPTDIYGKLNGETIPNVITGEEFFQLIENNQIASNVIDGTVGNDTIKGTAGNDIISGYTGNDTINAGAGNDIIYSGQGNDVINCTSGTNTIILMENSSDNADTTIVCDGGNVIIDFTNVTPDVQEYYEEEGVSTKYSYDNIMRTEVDGNDLIIRYSTNETPYIPMYGEFLGEEYYTDFNKTVRIKNFNNLNKNYDIKVKLSNPDNEETVYNLKDIAYTRIYHTDKSTPIEINGTPLTDNIYGSMYGDIINGGNGKDYIYAQAGDDIINGGDGDDYIVGCAGNDEIRGGAGDNIICYNEEYPDGTIKNPEDFYSFDEHLTGAEHDTIYSSEGTDSLYIGEIQSDIYASIDGYDLILSWGEGKFESSVTIKNYIKLGDEHSVKYIILDDQYASEPEGYKIPIIDYLADKEIAITGIKEIYGMPDLGDTISGSDLPELIESAKNVEGVLLGTEEDDTLIGTSKSEYIFGFGGNDTISGGSGDDVIYGGLGNDEIDAGAGDDTIYTGQGNDIIDGGKGTNTIVIEDDGEAGSETTIVYGGGTDIIDLTNVGYNGYFYKGDDGKVRGELYAEKDGNDLIIRYATKTDGYDWYGEDALNKSIRFTDFYSSKNANIKVKLNVENNENPVTMNLVDSVQTDIDYDDYPIHSTVLQIQGTFTNDYMHGSSGADIIHGEDGNDYISAGAGNDVLYGGKGNDRLTGRAGNDTLYGGEGENTIIFDAGEYRDETYDSQYYRSLIDEERYEEAEEYRQQHLTGGGDDTVYSGEGTDTIVVYDDDAEITYSIKDYDLILSSSFVGSDDKIYNSSLTIKDFIKLGNTHSVKYINTNFIPEVSENRIPLLEYMADKEIAITGIKELYGIPNLDDTISGSFLPELIESAKNVENVITGTNGNDNLKGTAKNDYIFGYAGNDTINGAAGDDYIYGNDGNDTIVAGVGNDTIDAGAGDDKLTGGKGNDTFVFRTTEQGVNTITDAEYTDTILIENLSKNSMYFAKDGNNLEIFYNNQYDDTNKIIVQNYFTKQKTGLVPTIKGNDGKIVPINYVIKGKGKISGTVGDDTIIGSSSVDTITALAGNDTIYGSLGADTITGGMGLNTIVYNTLADLEVDKITLTKGEQLEIDVAELAISNIEYTINKKNLDITITTAEGSKTFTLNNFAGADVTNNSTKTQPSSGYVKLLTTEYGVIDLRDRLHEVVTQTNYTGNWFNEYIDASSTPQKTDKKGNPLTTGVMLNGAAGNDEIIGSDYNDTIKGGIGDDIVYGGTGDDTISGEDGDDTLYANAGNDKLTGGKGNDIFVFNSTEAGVNTITDADNFDTILVENISKNNLVFGRSGNNLEIFYDENYDSSNRIIVQNYFTKRAKGLVPSIKGYDGEVNDINYLITGKGKITGTADGETIKGSSENDTITALGGNDTIYGARGNDVIKGGDGDDIIVGGEGDDKLYGDTGNNSIYFNLDYGNDIVYMNAKGNDKLVFDGYDAYLFKYEKSANNLVIKYTDDNENSVTVQNYFTTKTQSVDKIVNATFEQMTQGSYNEMLSLKRDIIINGTDSALGFSMLGNTTYVKGKRYIGNDYNNLVVSSTGYDEIYTGAGDDFIYMQSKRGQVYDSAGDDTYVVKSLANGTIIDDSSGNDVIRIEDVSKNINIVFDITSSGDIAGAYDSNNQFFYTDYLFLMNKTSLNTLKKGKIIPTTGVEIVGMDSIERIETKDGYFINNETINELKENVAGWLFENGYDSALQVINTGHKQDIESLAQVYASVEWMPINQ